MIQLRSIIKPADNCGAKKLRVIHLYGGSQKKTAAIGHLLNCVVDGLSQEAIVKDKEKVLVLLVRTRKEMKRPDGSYIRFDDNAGVIIDKEGNPRGTRIFGPIPREIKDLKYHKIASLAPEII
jgi:large subunit ribosomal protein L14